MYRCEACKGVSAPRNPQLRHVIYRIDRSGHKQIAREIPLCRSCYNRLKMLGGDYYRLVSLLYGTYSPTNELLEQRLRGPLQVGERLELT